MSCVNLKSAKLLLSGIGSGVIFWVVESAIEFSIFNKFNSLTESILYPGSVGLWMRFLFISLFTGFGFYIQTVLDEKEKISSALSDHKEQAENLIEVRNREIQRKNKALEDEKIEREKLEEKLQDLATIDPLTSVCNRRKFNEIFEQELKRIKRNPGNLSLVVCDIDHFEDINDRYGYYVGDQVLRTFAFVIGKHVRETDVLSRWGGEEFAILLTNSNIEGAQTFSEHLIKMIQEYPFKDIKTLSMSVGVTQYRGGDDADSLIKRADEALYEAKVNGRNCVVGV
ncbi:MAG: GGDEF domain-containing protein [Nitrospiria bacterium]